MSNPPYTVRKANINGGQELSEAESIAAAMLALYTHLTTDGEPHPLYVTDALSREIGTAWVAETGNVLVSMKPGLI